jgi:hypothetical protein
MSKCSPVSICYPSSRPVVPPPPRTSSKPLETKATFTAPIGGAGATLGVSGSFPLGANSQNRGTANVDIGPSGTEVNFKAMHNVSPNTAIGIGAGNKVGPFIRGETKLPLGRNAEAKGEVQLGSNKQTATASVQYTAPLSESARAYIGGEAIASTGDQFIVRPYVGAAWKPDKNIEISVERRGNDTSASVGFNLSGG